MAGPAISKMLEAKSFEVFDRLASHVWVLMHQDLGNVASVADVTVQLFEMKYPNQTQIAGTETANLVALLRQIVSLMRENMVDLSKYLRPHGEGSESTNQARWQPYNETMWDQFYTGLAAMAQRQLAGLAPIIEHVDKLCASDFISSDEQRTMMMRVYRTLISNVADLESLTRAETVNTILADLNSQK